jgi:hypothetical protein
VVGGGGRELGLRAFQRSRAAANSACLSLSVSLSVSLSLSLSLSLGLIVIFAGQSECLSWVGDGGDVPYLCMYNTCNICGGLYYTYKLYIWVLGERWGSGTEPVYV